MASTTTANKTGERPNPMTGPFFIAGAEPGDTLLVSIRDIRMTRNTGWTFDVLSPNVVDPQAVQRFPERRKTEWVIDAAKGRAWLAEPPPALAQWSVAVEPMIGCFGVAPDLGQAISTATSGRYGGNMDYRGFKAGRGGDVPRLRARRAVLPGRRPCPAMRWRDRRHRHRDGGGGDVHRAGAEGHADRLAARHERDEIFTIGNARPLDQALQHATTEMLDWLMAGLWPRRGGGEPCDGPGRAL